eukprot:10325513-Alexandrium_andersonii.AAC.1
MCIRDSPQLAEVPRAPVRAGANVEGPGRQDTEPRIAGCSGRRSWRGERFRHRGPRLSGVAPAAKSALARSTASSG